MQGTTSRSYIGGKEYQLDRVVEHAAGGESIVLCRDDDGDLFYLPLTEWERSAHRVASSQALVDGGAETGAPVTRRSTKEEKIAFLMSLFRGRTDVYGKGYVGKRTKEGKLDYNPDCSHRWVRGACPKLENSEVTCKECGHPSYVPLTAEIVAAHCRGHRDCWGKIQAVGIYVVVDGDFCYLLAADFDGPGWQEAASAFRDACRRHGLSPAVERSRSGNGAHVWVFFDGPVKASLARRVGEGLVSEARSVCTAVSFASYDRLFPLQDSVGPTNLGSLIALPLHGEAVRRGNSVFVDDDFVRVDDQCAYLSTLPKTAPELVAALADEFGKDPIGLPAASNTQVVMVKPSSDTPQERLALKVDVAMPAVVSVTLADGVHIACGELPASVINRLRRLAAFHNPEYSIRQNTHRSVRNVARFIDLSEMEGDELVLPRGCTEAALATLRDAGAEPAVNDCRAQGRRIHVSFNGSLREIQKPCRDNLVQHDIGVLVAPTAHGKSVIGASLIAAHQVSTLVIVPATSVLKQWHDTLTRFLTIDDEPPIQYTPTGRRRKHQSGTVGIIGGGKHLRSGIVDVALEGSLFEKDRVAGGKVVSPFVGEYGMLIVDEAHRVPSSTVYKVMRAARARYVYGMTATPKRGDGLDRILFLECGPLRHEVTVAEQMAVQGMRRLLIPRFTSAAPDLKTTTTWHALMDYISEDEGRNHLIASDALRAMRCGRTALVLTRLVEHARTLARLIEAGAGELAAQVVLLVGSDSAAQKEKALEDLRNASDETGLCIVATGNYLGVGFDFDRLDCLLLAGPVSGEGVQVQWVGRLHRTRAGKSEIVVLDYVDPAIPMFDNKWRVRLRRYKKQGYTLAEGEDLALVGLEQKTTPVGHLFSGKGFREALSADLSESTRRVVLASSRVRFARVKELMRQLKTLMGRGVAVSVVLKEPEKPTTGWRQVNAMLCDLGCDVRVSQHGGPLLDAAVIDDALVWFGGIAPLSYSRAEESSVRLVSREVAASLMGACGVEVPICS